MPTQLSTEEQTQMWSRVMTRLHEGEPLVTGDHFAKALLHECELMRGEPMPFAVQSQVRDLVHELNTQYPETYLAQGVRNAVRVAFAAGIERLEWTTEEIENCGWQVVRRFLRCERMQELLIDIQINPHAIDASATIRQVLDSLSTPAIPSTANRGRPPSGATPESEAQKSAAQPPEKQARARAKSARKIPDLNLALSLAAEAGGIDAEAAAIRVQEQEEFRLVLTEKEMAKVPQSLSVYVADGLLDETQAEQLRALYTIDDREQSGQIQTPEAEAERDLILTVDKRTSLHSKVRAAVASTVSYVQVFESLKKISNSYDAFLTVLVKHKKAVVDDSAGDRNTLLGKISKSSKLLELAVGLMTRTDPEVRLLAVRLPPYSQLAPDKLKPISNLTVDVDFIDRLRSTSAEDLADLFRAEDPRERARPAADILSLIHLLDHVIEATPFRMKLRMLMVNQLLVDLRPRLEDLFASGDSKEARRKAERVLRQRMDRQISSASKEEQAAAHKRGQALLQAMEQKLIDEDQGGASAMEEALKETPEPADHEEGLTEEEVARGVQLTRVEVRVAGRPKKIPTKIMPDPEDSSKLLIASRDPETGELTPQMRRGKKRHVEQGRDGVWRDT
ncbi:MAG: hypothetical protein HN712_03650 [Gemmatimonadetes bacterium]|jgi:hypothetical protein|nr:hypothetical protein [Gemmatimonadota bacterium]MBT6146626.1 hypothetical protein [Gemmatimonadota bacterium]MBT7859375.1 hypothetical protein [Gemmatimonadota bacterium]